MTSRFEKFSYLISELSKLLHKIEADELEALGLRGHYAIYILTIAKHRDGIAAAKISELCGRDKADVSRAISTLIDNGLAKRIEEDKKYRAPIVLTEKGKLLADSISKKAKSAVDFASRDISAEKRAVFYEALESIYINMKKMSKTGVPENND